VGVVDAAEIPPTFGLAPDRVQAIIAGGEAAVLRAVEGAEDDREAGRLALRERGAKAGDVLVAISASGATPFVLGGVDAAREVGARRVAITCHAESPLAAAVELAIVPEVGPEVIAGSTRLKGGLAQKMVLHLLSTAVMVRLGYVKGNLMTHLVPVNRKLRRRAERIVMALAGVDAERAARLLDAAGGRIDAAVELSRRGS
jgi:N-acetylmuramic acid 6-phosphate etherase